MKKILIASLLSLSLGLFAQAGTFDLFQDNIHQGQNALENYQYDKAMAHANSAEILYRRTLREWSKGNDPAEVWKANLAMQTNIVLLYMFLGQRLFDQNRYQDALKIYDKAIAIAPNFPCLHYEKGFTYFHLKQNWKSALALYEAKRLARFPARRNIINHFEESGSLYCGRAETDDRSDGLLRDLDKSIYYPLELDLSTGQKMPGQVVPGMGVNLMREGQSINIYLEEPLANALSKLGEPFSQKELEIDGKKRLHFFYSDIVLAFEPTENTLSRISFYQGTPQVNWANQHLAMGDHASTVLKKMGQAYGFDKTYMGVNEDLREYIHYPEIGLDFGISRQDQIGMISIYTLE